ESRFKEELTKLEDIEQKTIDQFMNQGKEIVVEVTEALKNYFGEYEVHQVEDTCQRSTGNGVGRI
ncbi:MAG: hypothetical protein ACO34H_04205, partial [Candidatus Puniceispirillaceae bacterium]